MCDTCETINLPRVQGNHSDTAKHGAPRNIWWLGKVVTRRNFLLSNARLGLTGQDDPRRSGQSPKGCLPLQAPTGWLSPDATKITNWRLLQIGRRQGKGSDQLPHSIIITASGTVSLSSQSSLHHSITLLLHYRFR